MIQIALEDTMSGQRPVETALQLTDLPEVAIQAIAKQLPAADIVRFECVCHRVETFLDDDRWSG